MPEVIFLRRRQPAAERFRTLLCLRYRSPPIDMARGTVLSEFHQGSVRRSPRYAPEAFDPRLGPPIESHIPAGQNPEAEAIRHTPARRRRPREIGKAAGEALPAAFPPVRTLGRMDLRLE